MLSSGKKRYELPLVNPVDTKHDADIEQSIKLRDAIKEYEANKWKVIGQKVGKPAKVSCDLYTRRMIFTNSSRPVNSMPKSTSRTFKNP